MSDVKKKNERADGLSRRSFLGVGSAVLATATSVGLTADARDDARKVEGDHASSNPGQENKPEFQDVSLNNWFEASSRRNRDCTPKSRRDHNRQNSCGKVGSDLEAGSIGLVLRAVIYACSALC